MGTVIRAEISKKNRYYISKHRYYELKHFCMQYREWVKERAALDGFQEHDIFESRNKSPSSPVESIVAKRSWYTNRIDMVETAATQTDPVIGKHILEGIVTGKSYDALNAKNRVPCCKDVYYELYRKFFWILDKMRS